LEGEGKGEGDKVFFRIVKAGFAHRRQMLKNNLGKIRPVEQVLSLFKQLNLNPKIRAQELTVEQWQGIARLWYNH
jgi:16S rRNA (adenine1518-N6/adenine1519-N6)-dimethyltransferase